MVYATAFYAAHCAGLNKPYAEQYCASFYQRTA